MIWIVCVSCLVMMGVFVAMESLTIPDWKKTRGYKIMALSLMFLLLLFLVTYQSLLWRAELRDMISGCQ